MTPEQRRRAGLAVARRIAEMRESRAAIARAAGVDQKTLRDVIQGRRWPTEPVQVRIERVLRWREGEFCARAVQTSADAILFGLADSELLAELHRRAMDREKREARLRAADRKRE